MPWTPITVPFTTYEAFKGEILISGLYDVNMKDDNRAQLDLFIEKYEAKLWTILLGKTVYDAFIAAITGATTPDAKWTTLATKLKENNIAANYTYYYYRRDAETTTAMTAEVQSINENSTPVSANVKMCRAWNEMNDQAKDLITWLTTNAATYEIEATTLSKATHTLKKINTFNL
jgi:hypothetical protein